jgi:hypothetical protein
MNVNPNYGKLAVGVPPVSTVWNMLRERFVSEVLCSDAVITVLAILWNVAVCFGGQKLPVQNILLYSSP